MGPVTEVPRNQVRPIASNADPGASPNTLYWAGDTPPADHHDPLRCFQGVACCEFRCELPSRIRTWFGVRNAPFSRCSWCMLWKLLLVANGFPLVWCDGRTDSTLLLVMTVVKLRLH